MGDDPADLSADVTPVARRQEWSLGAVGSGRSGHPVAPVSAFADLVRFPALAFLMSVFLLDAVVLDAVFLIDRRALIDRGALVDGAVTLVLGFAPALNGRFAAPRLAVDRAREGTVAVFLRTRSLRAAVASSVDHDGQIYASRASAPRCWRRSPWEPRSRS